MNTEKTPCSESADLSPLLNAVPAHLRHVHLMGICGTGMASLAGILSHRGYRVTGSDQNVYPPVSDFLEALSIPVLDGYAPENLESGPDLVVVGNVITKRNPEAAALSRLRIPYLSLPQALRHFAIDGRKSIVIAGTHGKTTTSALTAWVLESAGLDPGFMIGGLPNNFRANFKVDRGPYFVVEGDEYDSAFFDKGPKFLHYNPFIVILTSIEFDHADIYRDLDHVLESFRRLIGLLPAEGLLIANRDDPRVRAEIERCRARVETYGLSGQADWKAVDIRYEEEGSFVTILRAGEEYARLTVPFFGRHNIANLLGVTALAQALGVGPADLSAAVKAFKGVRRRQEIKGERGGVLVLDDFAHHPSAVKVTVAAVKQKYARRRLLAAFEPRSNSSRRNVFQEEYAASFDAADQVLVCEPTRVDMIPPEERFSAARLAADLAQRGVRARAFPDTAQLLEGLASECRPGDVVLFMSNGPFDHLPDRLLKRLGEF